jgi:hypothetical protein
MEELFPDMVEVVAKTTACLLGDNVQSVRLFTLSQNAGYHADADAILYGLSQLMLWRPLSSTAR